MSICATVGKPIITKKDVCIHDGFVVFEDLKSDRDYLYYYLSSIESDWSKYGQTGSQMNLNTDLINSIPVLLPRPKEQRAISEALSDTDAFIASMEGLLAKKRRIKAGIMQELLTGETRLSEFGDRWAATRLGDVSSFHKGKGLSKGELVPFGDEPCIHYGELFTKYPETIREIRSRTNTRGDHFRSVANDVLMPTSDVTPDGLAKASSVAIDGVVLGGDILVIRANADVLLGTFLAYLIRYSKRQILQLVTGTTVFHLYAADMQRFSFLLPSMAEQRAIIAVLDDMDVEIRALEAELFKARELKHGMMQELLTGRIRVI